MNDSKNFEASHWQPPPFHDNRNNCIYENLDFHQVDDDRNTEASYQTIFSIYNKSSVIRNFEDLSACRQLNEGVDFENVYGCYSRNVPPYGEMQIGASEEYCRGFCEARKDVDGICEVGVSEGSWCFQQEVVDDGVIAEETDQGSPTKLCIDNGMIKCLFIIIIYI